MSALLENAITAISMGVEDYTLKQEHRAQSAIRNFYSGVLLLAKEVLARAAPKASMDNILGDSYRPVPDGSGGVRYVQEGKKTVDLNALGDRFGHFGLVLDRKVLKNLSQIRNDIEHKYSTHTTEAVRAAIAQTFPVVADLFAQLRVSPAEALGVTWQDMLETREFYEREVEQCRKSRAAIRWWSKAIQSAELQCPHCSSKLIEQRDPGNVDQSRAQLNCRACGEELDTDEMITATLADAFWIDPFIPGEEGPISECPGCGIEAFLNTENVCAVCGYHRNYVQCAGGCRETLLQKDGARGPAYCDRCAEDADRAADAGVLGLADSPAKGS